MDKVVHFEIPADDLDRARKFYSETFGWNMNIMQQMGYTILITTPADEKGMPKEPGAINGSMMRRKAPITNPVITINVPDIAKALANIKKKGGSVIMEKMQVGDMGYSAYFKDTEGNILGLWQNTR